MKTQLRPLIVLFAALMLITGVIYPLTVTGLAQLLFPTQTNGSLIKVNGEVLGSALIGQDFSEAKFFWGRPSATTPHAYNAFDQNSLTGSAGSNFGPLSKNLVLDVQERVSALQIADSSNSRLIPVDLVTSSASGLDPDISLDAAYYQARRVAQARRMREEDVILLINKLAKTRQFGILGEPRVNVLKLNLALEGIQ